MGKDKGVVHLCTLDICLVYCLLLYWPTPLPLSDPIYISCNGYKNTETSHTFSITLVIWTCVKLFKIKEIFCQNSCTCLCANHMLYCDFSCKHCGLPFAATICRSLFVNRLWKKAVYSYGTDCFNGFYTDFFKTLQSFHVKVHFRILQNLIFPIWYTYAIWLLCKRLYPYHIQRRMGYLWTVGRL